MRIVAVGDALFSSRNLSTRLDPKLVDTIRTADASFVNAEFICPKRGTPPANRRFTTAQDAGGIDELKALGFDLVNFATNHTGDYGPQGVIDTIEACEERKVIHAGIGRSLEEARAAKFLDTPNGRVGLVAASATRSELFLASTPGVGVPARAGVNPLRWGRAYVLPDAEFKELQRIESLLGIAESRKEVLRVEVVKDPGPDRFGFGSFFEGSLQIERGDRAYVRYYSNDRDAEAILTHIRDAAARAEHVLFSLHTHEGSDENWYSERPASFVEDFAHRAIDAGAHAILCHGAHMLRGVEIYKGRPIFYNLNSIAMEFEAGEQLMTPEMYDAYGFGRDCLPSHMHQSRVADKDGNKIGFYAEKRFSRSVLAEIDIDDAGNVTSRLLPLDLDLNRPRVSDRGLPQIASVDEGRAIAEDLKRLSRFWGTEIRYNEATGLIDIG